MSWQKPSPITGLTSFFKSVKGNKAGANVSRHFPPHPSICSAADEEASRKGPNFQLNSTGDDTKCHIACYSFGPSPGGVIGSKFMVYVIESSMCFIQRQRNKCKKEAQIHLGEIYSDTYTLYCSLWNIYPGYNKKKINTVIDFRKLLIACHRIIPSCGQPICLLCVLRTVDQQDLNSKHTSVVTEQHLSLISARLKNSQ